MENLNLKQLKFTTIFIIIIIFVSIGGYRTYVDTYELENTHIEQEKFILNHIKFIYAKQIKSIKKALGARIKYLSINIVISLLMVQPTEHKVMTYIAQCLTLTFQKRKITNHLVYFRASS